VSQPFLRAAVVCSLLVGCANPVRVFVQEGPEVGPDTSADTFMPPTPGDVGAVCTKDDQCLSKFCLPIGRCSKACSLPGACPNSTNWTCRVIAGRGPMCDCDEISLVDLACNGIDENCDGRIDDGSPKCGDECVDTSVNLKHCGGCDKPCAGEGTPNATPVCSGGMCSLKCAMGFDDCDGMADTGCEGDLASALHCGKCGNACAMGESCVMGTCKVQKAVDVTILLGVTGSSRFYLDASIPNLQTKLAAPLLAIPDVQVGVSYTAEFPNTPYGQAGDRPFQGGGEPMTDGMKINGLISMYPNMMVGGDASDGMIEGLATLSGLPVHPASLALTCTAGRVAGGCWRPTARRVIVLFTDDIFHNGPNAVGPGLYDPYMMITPAPQDWTGVLKAMTDNKITLLFMASAPAGATGDAAKAQYRRMLTDLGQPVTDVYPASTAAESATSSDAIVARIKAIRDM
jgi:hypothetical protein